MRDFVRMFNAHEAREDTELFPALREIASNNEYACEARLVEPYPIPSRPALLLTFYRSGASLI